MSEDKHGYSYFSNALHSFHDPNVLFQPLLMKILKHIWRVLSTHSGPYQGLNMITTDCQNCLNNFHFLNTIFTFSRQLFARKDYKSMAASLSLVTLVSPCQWMAATASILAIVRSLHGNRLNGFMGLPSKMSDWMVEWSGYPLDSYDY